MTTSANGQAPRAITKADHAPLLVLNNEYAMELSYQTPEQFTELLDSAWLTRTIGNNEALLVAFDQDSKYDNPNFAWHAARAPRFVYIDRVVSAVQGRGDARRLYEDLRAQAKAAGHTKLVCEINVDPPNPASTAFHARFGFTEVGRGVLANGKTVGYFEAPL
ncbi:uncharacterized protein EHS24_003423 [Apiotrichum porosum]|uniref:N-acetyltransferase domain-containing protein n=1 Tax=Apiotrichum porosum TaxID=105984 RepID=A0A427XEW4_9TREE|nr:uncharacterized protein EHS24_003423 [Apiotrichum porosum]RSH77451.1 hypothetical protein EHS24_003423 [Apiotrichum porosum]